MKYCESEVAPLPRLMVVPLVQAALLEDMGRAGDVTSEATISPESVTTAVLRAREIGVVAGLDCAKIAFELVDPTLSVQFSVPNGAIVEKNTEIAVISGSARGILTAERVALNFAGWLSGIASLTRLYADQIAHTKAHITCTRKTTPGFRALEKRAVLFGGGKNHRFGLDDAILIKDNHIAAAGGLRPVLERASAYAGHLMPIALEVDTLKQLEEALLIGGAQVIMLDNMSLEQLRDAVKISAGRVVLEATGGITIENVRDVAETGVDIISSGALTHSAPNLDLGLDIDL